MNKLIIRNDSNLDDLTAMTYVSRVIQGGKISDDGRQYCYHSAFRVRHHKVHVSCVLRKTGTMTFYVTKEAIT